MTITTASQLQSAPHLHYKPRNTNYHVLHHNVRIKQPDGSWADGCVYQDIATNNIYTRPYSQFDLSKWELVD
jgi:hypothetical protein